MYIKFLNDGSTYDIETDIYSIGNQKIKIDDSRVPAKIGGFELVLDDGSKVDYSEYKVAWDKTDDFVIFSSDVSVYYTFYLYNEDKYVASYTTTTQSEVENGILKFSGKGRQYEQPEMEALYDEDGFFVYKVVKDEVVATTAADKAPYMEEKTAKDLADAKEMKEAEISAACAAAIVAGVDVNGSHYSYAMTDQNNISNLMSLAQQTGLDIPYHADGENCRLYTKEEIAAIYIAAEMNVTGQVTYNNQMKQYIETLEDIDAVKAIEFGTPLTGQYLETYNTMMAQAEEIIRHIIGEN